MKLAKYKNLLIYKTLVALFFIFFLISIPYYSGDVRNHVVWGRSILNLGASGFYERNFHDYSVPNYPPVSMFTFAASVRLYDITRDLVLNLDKYEIFPSRLVRFIDSENVLISFLKLPAIIPFLISGLTIYYLSLSLGKNFATNFFDMILFLLNPAFTYLAIVWGQNDFMQVMFILLALLFLFKEKFYIFYLSAGLAILSKQTALVAWGVLLIGLFKLKNLSKSIIAFIFSALLLWFLYMPFNNSSIFWPFTFYNESLRTTGLLASDNAINFWGFISGFKSLDSQNVFYSLKIEHWGLLLFAFLFLPLLLKFIKGKFTKEKLVYFLFLTSVTYFFLLTRMHERYLIFGVVFAQILFMVNRKSWFNLVFFSFLLLVNQYKGLLMPPQAFLANFVNSTTVLNVLAISYFVILIINYYYFIYVIKDEKD